MLGRGQEAVRQDLERHSKTGELAPRSSGAWKSPQQGTRACVRPEHLRSFPPLCETLWGTRGALVEGHLVVTQGTAECCPQDRSTGHERGTKGPWGGVKSKDGRGSGAGQEGVKVD